jgi:hypothetical protein
MKIAADMLIGADLSPLNLKGQFRDRCSDPGSMLPVTY